VIRVQAEDFDIAAEMEAIASRSTSLGAITSFVGVVRDMAGDGRASSMTLEHYPGMTERMLREIDEEACRRWPLEASLTTTYIAKYGTSSTVKTVCSRASNYLHERMLKAVGADRVTFPSREQGRQLGEQLVRPSLLDRLQLDSRNSIEEVQVPKEFIQRSLRDINLRKDYGVSVLAAGSQGDLRVNPPASMILSPNDVLVVMGSQEDIKRMHQSSDS